ncbi:MAG: UDP-N-acetylmuramoyl-L-alanine--D-glutamate ligase, partial [Sulfitobacter sp.]
LDGLAASSATVKKAYVIGREAAGFAMQLNVETEVCTTMDVAVARAIADSEAGDVVLLAPAAASFDQYDSFEKRGDDFTQLVKAHIEAA